MKNDKKHIWLNGKPVEVTEEVYEAYTKGARKMRYFEEDLKVQWVVLVEDGRIVRILPSREDSLDRLMADNADQFADERVDVEAEVLFQLEVQQLHTALAQLLQKDRQLIEALYFEEQTEEAVGQSLGISQQADSKRKNRILKKLQKILGN